MKAAIYARVSTLDQEPENQLQELRRYVEARGWTAVEYVDRGVSGAKDRRPALDQLLADAKRRRFDVLVCWRLDRLGRNLKHLITLLDDLQALGVAFVSLAEGIDATTPAGKLQMHILGAIAEFERERIVERVRAGLRAACGAGQAPRPAATDHQRGRPGPHDRVVDAEGGRAPRRLARRRPPRTDCLKNPSREPHELRLKRALFRARSAVTVATVTVTVKQDILTDRNVVCFDRQEPVMSHNWIAVREER